MSTQATLPPETPAEAKSGGGVVLQRLVRGHLSATLYLGDCKDLLPMKADLLLSDPPYGIAYDASESTQQGIQRFEMVQGDDEHFDPAHLMDYPDVILWGVNNYCNAIPPKIGQWYFWDKVVQNEQKVRIAEGEYAWHKRGTKPRAFRHLWSGAYRASESGERSEHPTQKPVSLMRWCLDKSDDAKTILDPWMGSGTTLIAARAKGIKADGIEINERYCEAAKRRLAQGELLAC